MAGSSSILKEYLIALGFKVDEPSVNKFDVLNKKIGANVANLAKGMLGAGVAAQAMVAQFAFSMEKLYYASKRTDATVANIQALEYAGQQLGLSSGVMQSSLEGMARAMRNNPGLSGLLTNLGVKVEGRDKSDVLADLVTELNKMPFYQATQYASLFGIDGDTLLMLEQNLDVFRQLREQRKEMNLEAGIDAQAAAEASKEYANQLRDILALFGVLKDAAAIGMLPVFRELASVTKEVLKDWTRVITSMTKSSEGGVTGFFGRLAEGLGLKKTEGGVVVSSGQKGRIAPKGDLSWMGGANDALPGGAVAESPGTLFTRLEKQYGLPDGLLDRMWAKESGRGKNMRSPVGAEGHFQFMPGTAKDMGLQDPYDLAQSATAASQYLAKLMAKYGGDTQKALAAYNWGPGNVDKKGLANAPWETQDYVASLSGQPISVTQSNTFHIASTDPAAAAREVGGVLDTTYGDLDRNMRGAVR